MALARPPKNPMRIERLRLRDGRKVVLRPIAPADAGPIAGGFPLLTDEEVRRRFQYPVKALGEEYLSKLVSPSADARVFVAAEALPAGDALVGAVARVARTPDDPRHAEFAILVSHFLAGQGLGTALLGRLVEAARALGVREVFGDVLDDNAPMLHLAARLGFKREAMHAQPGLTRVVRRLRAISPRKG
ncbi:MAG: GNAT family N-acetyltransferase [Arenimonas sp.]